MTSCHDTTLLALITAMGGFDEKWIGLGSYVAFELFYDENVNYNIVQLIKNRMMNGQLEWFIMELYFNSKKK